MCGPSSRRLRQAPCLAALIAQEQQRSQQHTELHRLCTPAVHSRKGKPCEPWACSACRWASELGAPGVSRCCIGIGGLVRGAWRPWWRRACSRGDGTKCRVCCGNQFSLANEHHASPVSVDDMARDRQHTAGSSVPGMGGQQHDGLGHTREQAANGRASTWGSERRSGGSGR